MDTKTVNRGMYTKPIAYKVPDPKCYWCMVPAKPLTVDDDRQYVTICKPCWIEIEDEISTYEGN